MADNVQEIKRGWFYRNSANMISISGAVGAFLALFCTNWIVPIQLATYVATEFSDLFDGKVARKLKIADGIGKVIDPVADKFRKFCVIYFLFDHPMVVFRLVIGLILLGEIAVLMPIGYATYLVSRREYHREKVRLKEKRSIRKVLKSALKNTRTWMLKDWQVNQEGKLTMVCYVAMFGMIMLRSIWMGTEIFIYLYVSWAIIGFTFRIMSFVNYVKKFLEWHERVFNHAIKAG